LWLDAHGDMNTPESSPSGNIHGMPLAAIIGYANWKEWLTVLLGAWLIVSPWMLGFAHTKAMHFSIATGVLVAFMAAIELLLVNYPPENSAS